MELRKTIREARARLGLDHQLRGRSKERVLSLSLSVYGYGRCIDERGQRAKSGILIRPRRTAALAHITNLAADLYPQSSLTPLILPRGLTIFSVSVQS